MPTKDDRPTLRGYSAHRILQLRHDVCLATDIALVLTKARTKAGLRTNFAVGPYITLLSDLHWQGPMGVRIEPQPSSRHDK